MLCACGSGLRSVRCCALDPGSLAGEAARPLLAWIEQARQAPPAEAARLCVQVLELAPDQADALWLLSGLRQGQGKDAAAEALLRRLVGLQPNHLAATQALALALIGRGASGAAEHQARNAIRLAPQHPQSHNLLALAVTEAGQPRLGEAHYRRALQLLGTREPILLANLAWSLTLQGRMAEARALYAESTAAGPGIFQSWLGAARLEEADRNFEAAAAHLDRAERLRPGIADVRLLRAVLQGRTGEPEAALATLEGLGRQAALGPEGLLQKGRLLDRLGETDAAFAAFAAGKALLRQQSGHSYQAAQAAALVQRLRGFFTRRRLASLAPVLGDSQPGPLFILGFPRSGTTLTEQMLSAHGSITAGGELPLIDEIVALMPQLLYAPLPYPEALSELWMGDRAEGLADLRDHYLRRMVRRFAVVPQTPFVTDKMPLNEMHLGLLSLLFPRAPKIHVQRHPLDVVLSVFATQLTHGFNCGFDLDSAARHYVLIDGLIEHYRAELPAMPTPLRYERLVAAPAAEMQRVLEAAGLAFEPECVQVDANPRYAPTASYAQVAEPVHGRAVGRWRRYRRHLEPVLGILAPVVERLGYALD